MTISAIIMMSIACIGLWGGAALSLVIMFRHSSKNVKEVIEEIEEAEGEPHGH